MSVKTSTADSRVKLATPELPPELRSGGENRPLDYPHLYQIQAGDWRISYAVEHNHLAILVLEVLNADGTSSKDVVDPNLKRKMKVKLLDWPEGSGTSTIPAEVVSKKMKIKWLDLAEDEESSGTTPAAGSRIKLKDAPNTPAASARRTITLLDSGEVQSDDDPGDDSGLDPDDRKVTPLDEPSM